MDIRESISVTQLRDAYAGGRRLFEALELAGGEHPTLADFDLSNAEFRGCEFHSPTFVRVNLAGAKFSRCALKSVKFEDCNVKGIVWDQCEIASLSMSSSGPGAIEIGSISVRGADGRGR